MEVDYMSATDSVFGIPVWLVMWNVIVRQRKKLNRVPQLLRLVLEQGGLCYAGVTKFH